jgi:hypothetical protein
VDDAGNSMRRALGIPEIPGTAHRNLRRALGAVERAPGPGLTLLITMRDLDDEFRFGLWRERGTYRYGQWDPPDDPDDVAELRGTGAVQRLNWHLHRGDRVDAVRRTGAGAAVVERFQ